MLLTLLSGRNYYGSSTAGLIKSMLSIAKTYKIVKGEVDSATETDTPAKSNNLMSSSQYLLGTKLQLKWVYVLLTFCVLYPLMVLACMGLPTWWNVFSLNGIKNYQVTVSITPIISFLYII